MVINQRYYHSKLYIYQQNKITNLVINQPYFPFKCMDVNILDKCIIKLPNLQQIMVFSRYPGFFKQ